MSTQPAFGADPAVIAEETLQKVAVAVDEAMETAKEAVGSARESVEKSVLHAREAAVAAKEQFGQKAHAAAGQIKDQFNAKLETLDKALESSKLQINETVVKTRSIWRRMGGSVVSWFDTSVVKDTTPVSIQEDKVDLLRVLPFLGVHLMCFGVIWVGFSWTALWVAVAMYVVRMFAITGFYHRYFSHKSFKTSRVFQFIMALWGGTCVQRGALWWAANHRHHHKHSDQPEDFHSPVQYSFWWSHMGWIMGKSAFETQEKQIPDLMKYPELVWLNRFDLAIPVATGAALFGLGALLETFAPSLGTSASQMLIWGFFISTVALFHGTVTINSLSHVWGSRRYKTKDDSRNNRFLAIITLGEGWHNNHHHYPGSTRQGFFWWEYDFTYYGLKAMSWLGLIWDLKPVPEQFKYAHRKYADKA